MPSGDLFGRLKQGGTAGEYPLCLNAQIVDTSTGHQTVRADVKITNIELEEKKY